MLRTSASLHLKNAYRSWKPIAQHVTTMDASSLEGQTLLLHAVDSPLYSIHRAEELRSQLAPLAGRVKLSFDDGYAHTWPLLQMLAEDGHHITLFVCTHAIESDFLPKDRLMLTCLTMPRHALLDLGHLSLRVMSDDPKYRYWLGFTLNRHLMDTLPRAAYAKAIETATANHWEACRAHKSADRLNLADPKALCDLLRSHPQIEVGLHGHCHFRLDHLSSPEDFNAEITQPTQQLEQLIGRPIKAIAPPYGLTSRALNKQLSEQFEEVHLLADRQSGAGATTPVFRVGIDRTHIRANTLCEQNT